jgi:hypothetical protein
MDPFLSSDGDLPQLGFSVASFAKNQSFSQAGEANFKQVKRTISVLLKNHCIFRVPNSPFHPPCVDNDTRTFVTFERHDGIRNVRFPTDHAITNGQVPGVDLEIAGQPEVSASPFVRSRRETGRGQNFVHCFGLSITSIGSYKDLI